MSIYWSSNSIPELAALSKARRKVIWTQCRSLGPRWLMAVNALIPAAIMIASLLLMPLSRGHSLRGLFLLAQVIVTASLLLAANHFRIKWSLPEIRKQIGGLCLACGYDLRATPARCPECGTPRKTEPAA